MGTGPANVGKPMPRSSHQRTTPSQAASPNADPPVSTTALMDSTVRPGSSSAHSRVPGAAPRTSPEAVVPAGRSTTVQPVLASASVQWPTRTPGTDVIMPASATNVKARHPAAHAANHLIGDGAGPRCPFPGGDGLIPLPAEQHDFVADRHRRTRPAVDQDLVHGHGAGDRASLAADEHLTAGGRQRP